MTDESNTLLLDATTDLSYNTDTHDIDIVDGIDKIKQDLVLLLRTVKGEDAINPLFGVDWVKVMEYRNDVNVSDIISRALLTYPLVDNVIGVDVTGIDTATRQMSINVSVLLTTNEAITLQTVI